MTSMTGQRGTSPSALSSGGQRASLWHPDCRGARQSLTRWSFGHDVRGVLAVTYPYSGSHFLQRQTPRFPSKPCVLHFVQYTQHARATCDVRPYRTRP